MGDHDSFFGELESVARLAAALGQVRRATQHADGEPESDTTHTVMLALVSYAVAERSGLDPAQAVVMALVHDLPEAIAGDVVTIRPLSAEERAAKDAAEAAAVQRISNDAPWLGRLIEAYEAQETPVARMVRVLDKVMPKLTHAWTGCSVPRSHGVDLEELDDLHATQGAKLRAAAPEAQLAHAFFDWAAERAHASWVDAGGISGVHSAEGADHAPHGLGEQLREHRDDIVEILGPASMLAELRDKVPRGE